MKWMEAADSKEWDDFVSQNRGSVFHRWSWRKVIESEGFKPYYLVCRSSDGAPVALCPYVLASGRRFFHLTTLPDTFLGGPIVMCGERNLREILGTLPRAVRFSVMRPITTMHTVTHLADVADSMKSLGFEFRLDDFGLLMTDLEKHQPDHVWSNGFNKHDRQAVKHYDSQGAVFKFSADPNDFADYISLEAGANWSLLDRGDFFQSVERFLPDSLKVCSIQVQGKMIAALLVFNDPSIMTVHLMGMRYRRGRNIHSSVTFANWRILDWASSKRYRFVNFGPWLGLHVVDSAHYAYKLKRRFEADFYPRFHFVLRPQGITYSLARIVNKVLPKAGSI